MNNEMKFEKNGLLIPNGALEELGLSGISLSAWLGQDHILLMPQEMTALQLLHALEGLSRASVELLGVLQVHAGGPAPPAVKGTWTMWRRCRRTFGPCLC